MKNNTLQLMLIFMLCGVFIASAEAKSILLTTYYPPPNGAFDQLRIMPQSRLNGICKPYSIYHNGTDKTINYCNPNGQWQLLKDPIWNLSGTSTIATPSLTNPNLNIGIGTDTPEFKLSIENNAGIIALGDINSGRTLQRSGQGTYFLWYPRKSATVRGTFTKDIDFGLGTQISTVSPHIWDDSLIGQYTVVGGGRDNAANYLASAVGGGQDNLAGRSINADSLGSHNTVIGGFNNKAYIETGGGGAPSYSGILGGKNNTLASFGGGTGGVIVLGGESNNAGWNWSVAVGGQSNNAAHNYSTIAGGKNNTVSGMEYSSVVGGLSNANYNTNCTIVGGQNNIIVSGPSGGGIGEYNTNGAGTLNGANFIGGGNTNVTGGCIATVVGGYRNIAINSGIVLGGENNVLQRLGPSSMVDPPHDPVSAQNSFSGISGGLNNLISVYTGNQNVIAGGMKNTISNINSNITVENSFAAGVANLISKGHVFSWGHGGSAVIPATGDYSVIPAVTASLVDANVEDVFTIRTGRVGIGTLTPSQKLHVNGNVRIDNGTLILTSLSNVTGSILKRGSTGVNTGIIGKDLAEILTSTNKVEAGDVLSLAEGQKIQRTHVAYDTKVVGIASTAPAIFLQEGKMVVSPGEKIFTEGTEVPLALKGRTLCKVSAEGGPIKPGDLLTSASLPGYAMKATDPLKSNHSIIGKALQSFNPKDGERSTGKIIIMVTLQ